MVSKAIAQTFWKLCFNLNMLHTLGKINSIDSIHYILKQCFLKCKDFPWVVYSGILGDPQTEHRITEWEIWFPSQFSFNPFHYNKDKNFILKTEIFKSSNIG